MSGTQRLIRAGKVRWRWAALPVLVIGLIVVGILLMQRGSVWASTLPMEVDLGQAAAHREAGAFMLDVRQPDEWVAYHLPGSTLIPLGELNARLSEVPRDQEIIVVCRSGSRSALGRDILLKAGFGHVTSLAGGLSTWRSEGYPTVSGP
jgi:rhodanese-related sulfurtransferase